MTDRRNGLARERARARRRRLIAAALMASGIGYGVGVGRLGQDGTSTVVATAAFLAIVAVGGWLSWRDRDEVERREAAVAFGASGFSLLLLFPLLKVAQPVFHFGDPVLVLGTTCTAVGLTVWTIRRFRS